MIQSFKNSFLSDFEIFFKYNFDELDIFKTILNYLTYNNYGIVTYSNWIKTKISSFDTFKQTLVDLKNENSKDKNKIHEAIEQMDNLLYEIENYFCKITPNKEKKLWINITLHWIDVIIEWRKAIKPFMVSKSYAESFLDDNNLEKFLEILKMINPYVGFNQDVKNKLIDSLTSDIRKITHIQELKKSDQLEYERLIRTLPGILKDATKHINEVETYLEGMSYKYSDIFERIKKRVNTEIKNKDRKNHGSDHGYVTPVNQDPISGFIFFIASIIIHKVFKVVYVIIYVIVYYIIYSGGKRIINYLLSILGLRETDLTKGIRDIILITNETEYFLVIIEYIKNRVAWDKKTESIFKQKEDERGPFMSQFYDISFFKRMSSLFKSKKAKVTSAKVTRANLTIAKFPSSKVTSANGKSSHVTIKGGSFTKKRKKTNTLKYS